MRNCRYIDSHAECFLALYSQSYLKIKHPMKVDLKESKSRFFEQQQGLYCEQQMYSEILFLDFICRSTINNPDLYVESSLLVVNH